MCTRRIDGAHKGDACIGLYVLGARHDYCIGAISQVDTDTSGNGSLDDSTIDKVSTIEDGRTRWRTAAVARARIAAPVAERDIGFNRAKSTETYSRVRHCEWGGGAILLKNREIVSTSAQS